MSILNSQEHHLIAIYGDNEQKSITTLVQGMLPSKDTRILNPLDEDSLLQAAGHSSLIIIGLENAQDTNVFQAARLKEHRHVVCDIIGVLSDQNANCQRIMAKNFDYCLPLAMCDSPDFKNILKNRVIQGSKRVSSFILEEEYRRFSDALSCAPTSIMVFDEDKRIVFVSEHYFRAYPKSAARLIRGLSVYEAFDMMSKEEDISEKDPLYQRLRDFWYNLTGSIEFTLDTGVSYRLKAATLPNGRGAIVTAQNITEYVEQNKELKSAIEQLNKAKKHIT